MRRKRILFLSFLVVSLCLIAIYPNSIIEEKALILGGEELFGKAVPFNITNNGEFAAHANGGGTGAPDDPWIIQNLDINASGEAVDAILIANTTAHFIIKNCTIYEMDAFRSGIKLENVSNGCLTNNTIYNGTSSTECGIFLKDSSNNNVSFNYLHDIIYALTIENSSFNNFTQNNFYNHTMGIRSYTNSKNNTINHNIFNLGKVSSSWAISFNTLCDFNFVNNNTIRNFTYGIYVQGSYYNNFTQNVIYENVNYGMFLQASSGNNQYFNNTIYNCGIGIYSASNATLIQKNNIHNNTKTGIYLDGDYQQLTDNQIYNNSEDGVYISGQNNSLQGNQIFNNELIGINVTGDKNNISSNNVSSNNLFGIFISGDFNYIYRNLILENYDGTVSTQKGDTGINNDWIQNVLSYELDSDGDTITDYVEIFVYGTDPTLVDTDNDGLSDGLELIYGTNPLDSDSDGDGYLDGVEVGRGTDPLNQLDNPLMRDILTIILIITVASIIVGLLIVIILLRKKVNKLENRLVEFNKSKAKSGVKSKETVKEKPKRTK